ncbi:transposase [Streptomyces afghaniensis]
MTYPDGGGLTAVERARREQVRFQAAEMFAAGFRPPRVARALRGVAEVRVRVARGLA